MKWVYLSRNRNLIKIYGVHSAQDRFLGSRRSLLSKRSVYTIEPCILNAIKKLRWSPSLYMDTKISVMSMHVLEFYLLVEHSEARTKWNGVKVNQFLWPGMIRSGTCASSSLPRDILHDMSLVHNFLPPVRLPHSLSLHNLSNHVDMMVATAVQPWSTSPKPCFKYTVLY